MNTRIALISNGLVENIIRADSGFAGTLGYDLAIDVTDIPHAAIGGQYIDGIFQAPVLPDLVPGEHARHIYPGAFKSRLGMDALAIGASNDEVCRAVASSLNDRLYVDLDGAETAMLLDILIANSQPAANPKFPTSGPMTLVKKAAILGAQVALKDRYKP